MKSYIQDISFIYDILYTCIIVRQEITENCIYHNILIFVVLVIPLHNGILRMNAINTFSI